jgi:hypothetical protein
MNHESLTLDQRQMINEFVASKMGWRPPDHPDTAARTQGYCMPEKWWMDPAGELQFRHNVPDLFASLDTCHVAEKVLSERERLFYHARLIFATGSERIPGAWHVTHASAEHRALALFQTLGGAL